MIGKWNLQMLQTRFEHNQMSRPLGHGSNVAFFPSLAVCRSLKSPLSGTYLPINNSWKYLMLVLRWTTGDLSNRQNQSWIFCCWHHLLFPFQGHTFSPDVLRKRIAQTDLSCTCWFKKADMNISALTWKFDLTPTIIMDIFWSLLWLWNDSNRYNCRLEIFNAQSWYQNLESRVKYIISIMIYLFFYSLTIAKKNMHIKLQTLRKDLFYKNH